MKAGQTARWHTGEVSDPTPVESLPLSNRVVSALRRAGIGAWGEICALPEDELLRWRSFGVRSVEEIRTLLAWHGRALRQRGWGERGRHRHLEYHDQELGCGHRGSCGLE